MYNLKCVFSQPCRKTCSWFYYLTMKNICLYIFTHHSHFSACFMSLCKWIKPRFLCRNFQQELWTWRLHWDPNATCNFCWMKSQKLVPLCVSQWLKLPLVCWVNATWADQTLKQKETKAITFSYISRHICLLLAGLKSTRVHLQNICPFPFLLSSQAFGHMAAW